MKYPYEVLNGDEKCIGKFRTEKQARNFARKTSKIYKEPGYYESLIVVHFYNQEGILCAEDIQSYRVKRK